MKLTHAAALAAVSAGCAGAFAGEFQSALVGKVKYDDDPAMVVSVDRTKGADVYVVNATDATSVVVEEGGVLRRVPAKPCSPLRLPPAR